MTAAAHIAVLAPVHSWHLVSGQQTLELAGQVAFASNCYDLFEQLEEQRHNLPVDMYLCATHIGRSFEVAWRARYTHFRVGCRRIPSGWHAVSARLDRLRYRGGALLPCRCALSTAAGRAHVRLGADRVRKEEGIWEALRAGTPAA